jgi:hypothetical protein
MRMLCVDVEKTDNGESNKLLDPIHPHLIRSYSRKKGVYVKRLTAIIQI